MKQALLRFSIALLIGFAFLILGPMISFRNTPPVPLNNVRQRVQNIIKNQGNIYVNNSFALYKCSVRKKNIIIYQNIEVGDSISIDINNRKQTLFLKKVGVVECNF